ncbi:hypothetical protein HN958_00445 [Candidatus Falkowbacteria bacterium]|jgi:hypothetical protein|nr:hypothetical protein [Candidatus Falkowbacteria bacterium]MBT7006958.1 hypothetical protein [Candidatus Falkowbacteria bacterium]
MSRIEHSGRIPDLIKAHNSKFFFIYPFRDGRLNHFFEEVNVPHETEDRLIIRPRGWVFHNDNDIDQNGLIRVDHHLRGILTGNLLEMQIIIETMKEMGFQFNNSLGHVPCSSGQKEELRRKNRPFSNNVVTDFTHHDLLQLHPARLPMRRIQLIESFWRFAPEEKKPELRAILSGTAA